MYLFQVPDSISAAKAQVSAGRNFLALRSMVTRGQAFECLEVYSRRRLKLLPL